jgi:hypothetical protein
LTSAPTVEDCSVFPLQQAHSSVLVRQADADAGRFFADDGGGFGLVGRIHQREHAGKGHGPYAGTTHIPHNMAQLIPVQG